MKDVKVWECKIVVPGDAELPAGFDSPLRRAAMNAVEDAGIEVLGCSSGWGGSLTRQEQEAFEALSVQPYPDVYIAGTMDQEVCEHGNGMTDYCSECGRVNGSH